MSEAGHYHSIVERISLVKLAQFARPIDKEVLSALAWRGNFKTGTNCCPSLATLAADVGVDRRTVASSVQRLQVAGYVTGRRRPRATTVYAVVLEKLPTTRCASDQAITTKYDSDQNRTEVVIKRSPDPLSTDPLKERGAEKTIAAKPPFLAPRPRPIGIRAPDRNCPHLDIHGRRECRSYAACFIRRQADAANALRQRLATHA